MSISLNSNMCVIDGLTDGPKDQWTDTLSYRDARSHLKRRKRRKRRRKRRRRRRRRRAKGRRREVKISYEGNYSRVF